MITQHDIYDFVESRVNTSAHPIYCTSRREPVPESFPCCFILLNNSYRDRQSVALDFADAQKHFLYEVQTFSDLTDGALDEANQFMDYAEEAFNAAKFICTFRRQVDNADPSIMRVLARFERIVGDSDTL